MNIAQKFPPLYECSVCGKSVDIVPQGLGVEPIKKFQCEHTSATIWANRKVDLYGKGDVNLAIKTTRRIKLTLRQFLSFLTKRSV